MGQQTCLVFRSAEEFNLSLIAQNQTCNASHISVIASQKMAHAARSLSKGINYVFSPMFVRQNGR